MNIRVFFVYCTSILYSEVLIRILTDMCRRRTRRRIRHTLPPPPLTAIGSPCHTAAEEAIACLSYAALPNRYLSSNSSAAIADSNLRPSGLTPTYVEPAFSGRPQDVVVRPDWLAVAEPSSAAAAVTCERLSKWSL